MHTVGVGVAVVPGAKEAALTAAGWEGGCVVIYEGTACGLLLLAF